MGQLVLGDGTYEADVDFPSGVSVDLSLLGGGGGGGAGKRGGGGYNDRDGDGGEGGFNGQAAGLDTLTRIFAPGETITASVGAGGIGGVDNIPAPATAGSPSSVTGIIALNATGGAGGNPGGAAEPGSGGGAGSGGVSAPIIRGTLSSGNGVTGTSISNGGSGGPGGTGTKGYGAAGAGGGGGGGGEGHLISPSGGGSGGIGGDGAPGALIMEWNDDPTGKPEFRINGSIVPENTGLVRFYAPTLDPVTYPDGYVNVTSVVEDGTQVWFKTDTVPEAVVDFTASDDQLGLVIMNWTELQYSGTVSYSLFSDVVELIVDIAPGYQYAVAAGTANYNVKAINIIGSTDSNIDPGTSL